MEYETMHSEEENYVLTIKTSGRMSYFLFIFCVY